MPKKPQPSHDTYTEYRQYFEYTNSFIQMHTYIRAKKKHRKTNKHY